MILFTTRTKARQFATKREDYQFIDNGADSVSGRRWGVKVLKVL